MLTIHNLAVPGGQFNTYVERLIKYDSQHRSLLYIYTVGTTSFYIFLTLYWKVHIMGKGILLPPGGVFVL